MTDTIKKHNRRPGRPTPSKFIEMYTACDVIKVDVTNQDGSKFISFLGVRPEGNRIVPYVDTRELNFGSFVKVMTFRVDPISNPFGGTDGHFEATVPVNSLQRRRHKWTAKTLAGRTVELEFLNFTRVYGC